MIESLLDSDKKNLYGRWGRPTNGVFLDQLYQTQNKEETI